MRALTLAYLFFIGSVSGWILEVFYRRFLSSANPERKWINPGACTGPYLPLYGCGLCILYILARLEGTVFPTVTLWSRIALFVTMAVSMTAIEYIAGILSLKVAKMRLWDYSEQWGNVQGIICPLFSLIWAVISILYFYFLHPHILQSVRWLHEHIAFSFVIGMFYGVFLLDVAHSAQLVAKLKKYADENQIVIRFEAIKSEIRKKHVEAKRKYHFFLPFHSFLPLSEHLQNLKDTFEKIKPKDKK